MKAIWFPMMMVSLICVSANGIDYVHGLTGTSRPLSDATRNKALAIIAKANSCGLPIDANQILNAYGNGGYNPGTAYPPIDYGNLYGAGAYGTGTDYGNGGDSLAGLPVVPGDDGDDSANAGSSTEARDSEEPAAEGEKRQARGDQDPAKDDTADLGKLKEEVTALAARCMVCHPNGKGGIKTQADAEARIKRDPSVLSRMNAKGAGFSAEDIKTVKDYVAALAKK